MMVGQGGRGAVAVVRHARLLAFVCAILLALPSIKTPLFQDDVVHRAVALKRLPGVPWGPLGLYDFIGAPGRSARDFRELGFVPWFAADDLQIRFFRPLTSAILVADAKLFGPHVWASRLHSLAWFLAVLGFTAALYRRFLTSASAGIALLIYTVAFAHLMPVSWIAARHGSICTVFSLLTFWLHVRGRDERRSAERWLAPVVFGIGLLAGEMTLGVVALVGAWELLGRRDPASLRVRALVPFAGIAAAYLAIYAVLGYGIRDSGAYVGLDSGVSGAGIVLRHLLILVGELIAGTPSDAVGGASALRQALAALWGVIAVFAAWLLFRFSRAHIDVADAESLTWMSAAAVAGALPGAFALTGGRVLTLALVPASAVVAVLLVAGTRAVRAGHAQAEHPVPPRSAERATARRAALPRRRRVFVAITVAMLSFGHLIAAPALRLYVAHVLARVSFVQQQQAARVSCSGVMVILESADPTIATYVPATMALERRSPQRLRVLSMAVADHRIENVTATGFDLVVQDPPAHRSIWERLYRDRPLPAGTRVTISSLDATVIQDRDGVPLRVRFDFGEPLDSPHLCFFQWKGGTLVRFAPPKPGEAIDIPHQPGPMGW